MKKNLPLIKFILLILVVPFYGISFGQTQEIKITLTGYSDDVVADTVLNTLPTSITTNSIDTVPLGGDGAVFYAQGYSYNSTPLPNGLPANRQFTSLLGHNFQLAPYDQNNSLRIGASQSGTLTFDLADQTPYDSIFILATGGGGGPIVNYTIHFTDASTTSGGGNIDDWFCNGCTSFAINNLGRADRVDGTPQGSPLFAIYEYGIVLSAGDATKSISSIDFSIPAAQTGVANIFGITGYMPVALPVTLEYFNIKAVNGSALLQWKTSQELNTSKYIIERASNANPSSFIKVGEVNATSSATGSTYNFTNTSGVSGVYLYRLLQEDIDGKIKILGTRSISFNVKRKWIIQDLGTQWQVISDGQFIYRLIDMHGRILSAATGSGSATISKPVAHGIYEIQVQTGGEFSTQKLIK